MNKYIVFDLDGTLINTLRGITEALNVTLAHYGYGYHYSDDEVRNMIGHGARYLLSMAVKKSKVSDEEYNYYLIQYVKYQGISEVFAGVLETLEILNNRGIKMIIYSNKPNGALQFLVKEKFKDINFVYIQGNTDDYPAKPDPTLLNKIIDILKLNKEEGYYVGDSYVDCETAQNVGLKSVIVTYGYGNYKEIDKYNPDFKINEFGELLSII